VRQQDLQQIRIDQDRQSFEKVLGTVLANGTDAGLE
jgi:hypothetical protein